MVRSFMDFTSCKSNIRTSRKLSNLFFFAYIRRNGKIYIAFIYDTAHWEVGNEID